MGVSIFVQGNHLISKLVFDKLIAFSKTVA